MELEYKPDVYSYQLCIYRMILSSKTNADNCNLLSEDSVAVSRLNASKYISETVKIICTHSVLPLIND
jgi:hypothetical protein